MGGDWQAIEDQIRVVKTQFFHDLFRSDIEFDLESLGLVIEVDDVDLALVSIAAPKH